MSEGTLIDPKKQTTSFSTKQVVAIILALTLTLGGGGFVGSKVQQANTEEVISSQLTDRFDKLQAYSTALRDEMKTAMASLRNEVQGWFKEMEEKAVQREKDQARENREQREAILNQGWRLKILEDAKTK